MEDYHRFTKWLAVAAVAVGVGTGRAVADADKKPDFPKFEEVTKDMQVREGFLTLYHHQDQDRLLARVPAKMLGERFLATVSIVAGPYFASWQWSHTAVYFERMDKKLVLIEADPRYARGEGSELADVIGRTYTDTILTTVDIVTEAPGGDPVIDVAGLCKNDLAGIGGLFGGRVDASLSRYEMIKVFSDNIALAVKLAVMGGGPMSSGTVAAVHYGFSRLPKSDYQPRLADDRLGYFFTAVKDWTSPHNARSIFKRYIHRWHLKKVDPQAKVSDVTPETQIVFYIEKTVPQKYRRYIREGILEWNRAFEKAGLRNAIVVRQQTETNEFKDFDPEDVRYSFFRWIVTGGQFAAGLSRANPFTGQVFDADIICDDSMIRSYLQDYDVYSPRALSYGLTDPMLDEFLQGDHACGFDSCRRNLTPEFLAGRQWTDSFDPVAALRKHDRPVCEIGAGIGRDLALSAALFAQSAQRDLPEEFVGQVLRELATHEVGHTLGLRHNFKASTWRSMAQIKATRPGGGPTSASVMDYNANVYAPSEIEQGLFVTESLGPYDYWAIEYGYRQLCEADDLKTEEELLATITARVAEPGLEYGTDEDSRLLMPDPTVNAYDNGDDPIAFARDRTALAERLRRNMTDWAVKDGESYQPLRQAFNLLLGQQAFASQIVARQVGGQYVRRDHKGDPNERPPFEVVPAARQREAVRHLGETILSGKPFDFDPALLNKLGPGRWYHWDSDQMDFTIEYELHDRIGRVQSFILFQLLNPLTLNRLRDNQVKVPADQDCYTLPEHCRLLTDLLWSELAATPSRDHTNRQARITSVRRCVQREYVERLISIALTDPNGPYHPDCGAVVRLCLQELQERITRTLTAETERLDDYTLAHLSEAGQRIAKALEAGFNLD